jgi:hypothetical protein
MTVRSASRSTMVNCVNSCGNEVMYDHAFVLLFHSWQCDPGWQYSSSRDFFLPVNPCPVVFKADQDEWMGRNLSAVRKNQSTHAAARDDHISKRNECHCESTRRILNMDESYDLLNEYSTIQLSTPERRSWYSCVTYRHLHSNYLKWNNALSMRIDRAASSLHPV